MEIINNKLTEVEYRPSPNHGGIITPTYIIEHFTAADTAESAISWMDSPVSKVSAHLHIDRNGKIVQLVPFNIQAWHAGVSTFRDVVGLNSHAIGIEIQNTGSQLYTKPQMDSVIAVSKLIKDAYHIKEIIGHEDIAPLRKSDPSGTNVNLFDWASLLKGCGFDIKTLKSSANLNIRRGQGTQYPIVATIKPTTEVYELNHVGDWTKVQVKDSLQAGWVSSKYLI